MKWNEIMIQLRESVVDVEWVLDAALRVVEAQSIPDYAELTLRNMIFAMQDSKKALPTLPPAQ